MSECRSCQAPLRWARTQEGKPMPLDAVPAENGNVRVLEDGSCETVGPLEVAIAQSTGEPLYLSHFATCPEREHWRGTSRADLERTESA